MAGVLSSASPARCTRPTGRTADENGERAAAASPRAERHRWTSEHGTSRRTSREQGAGSPRSPRGWGCGRLLVAIGLVAVTTLTVGLVGIQRMAVLSDKAEQVHAEGAVPLDALRQLQAGWWQFSATNARASISELPAETRAAFAQASTASLQVLTEATEAAGDLPLSDEARAGYEQFAAASQQYLGLLQQLSAGQGTRTPEQTLGLIAQMNDTEAAISAALVTATDAAATDAAATAVEARAAYTAARTLTLAIIAVGLLVSVVLALLVVRSVMRPVQRVREVLDQVAGGDLSVRAGETGGAELGEVARSLDSTLDSLSGVLTLVNESAGRLAGASQALNAGAAGMPRARAPPPVRPTWSSPRPVRSPPAWTRCRRGRSRWRRRSGRSRRTPARRRGWPVRPWPSRRTPPAPSASWATPPRRSPPWSS
ncbi:methyl-accepting chemotaxis protein [uncultured Modestobacter sp.]|uniref:HAMP domain-containing protein n=1 Tax=uncultured Modestobacter sp. TaxID=380048 RepID=UPI00261B2037|nr:methyl-accepting chemotaxis protein [uncultured Modestobacter sp.]